MGSRRDDLGWYYAPAPIASPRCPEAIGLRYSCQGIQKLAGEEDVNRIREGDYRIIYTIRDKELIVLVLKSGGRKEIYR